MRAWLGLLPFPTNHELNHLANSDAGADQGKWGGRGGEGRIVGRTKWGGWNLGVVMQAYMVYMYLKGEEVEEEEEEDADNSLLSRNSR